MGIQREQTRRFLAAKLYRCDRPPKPHNSRQSESKGCSLRSQQPVPNESPKAPSKDRIRCETAASDRRAEVNSTDMPSLRTRQFPVWPPRFYCRSRGVWPQSSEEQSAYHSRGRRTVTTRLSMRLAAHGFV